MITVNAVSTFAATPPMVTILLHTFNSARADEARTAKETANAPRYSASDVVSARQQAGHTQTQAAAMVYRKLRTWQDWEGGKPIDPAVFELYLIKTNGCTVAPVYGKGDEK